MKPMTKKISLPPILIIDDDPLVLETLGDLCASMDCKRQVHRLDTKSAFDAAADPDIGLIVCDYRFPNASGIAFIEQVRRRGVETPVLFISGTPDNNAVLAASCISKAAFLAKPFTIDRFRSALLDLLKEPSCVEA